MKSRAAVACGPGIPLEIVEIVVETPERGTVTADGAVTDYRRRRRSRDPDLWVIELDIAGAERFAAETLTSG